MPGFHSVTREGSTSDAGGPQASPHDPASLPPLEAPLDDAPLDEPLPPPDEPFEDPPLEELLQQDPPLEELCPPPSPPLSDELLEPHAACSSGQLATTSAAGITRGKLANSRFE
jgi:hypothetical protein